VRPSLLAFALLGLAVCACGADRDGPAAEEREQLDPDTERLLGEIRRARDRAAVFHASARAQVKNAGSHRDGLEKARRVFDGLRVGVRIPDEADHASIEDVLGRAAREAALTLGSVTIDPVPRAPDPPPAEVETPHEPAFADDHVREVLFVRFTARPADIGRVETFDQALAASDGRLVVLNAARATPAGFEMEAAAYRFVPVDPPRVVARAPTESELLADPFLEEHLPSRRDDPEVQAELEQLRAELRAIEDTLPETNRALEPVGETAVWVARTSFYERVLTEREGRPTASILR
jgi:hypothetical protein